jgi:hypothetical protein
LGIVALFFLALFTKGGFVLIGLIPAAAYILISLWQNKTKNKLIPWLKKNYRSVLAIKLGSLAILAGLYFLVQKSMPQLLSFMFSQGNLGEQYLKLGFRPEALFYILILAIPWSFFLSAYWLRKREKKFQAFENFLKIWFLSLLVFFLFFTTRTGATNYFLIMLFPLSYWIAAHLESRLKALKKFHWSQILDIVLFFIFGLVIVQLLISPTNGINMIFKSWGIGFMLIGFVLSMLVFIFKPQERWIKIGLGLYVATLMGILALMPAYQKNYEFYANLIPYFKAHPEIKRIHLYGWHNELVYPSFIKFYKPEVELISNSNLELARPVLRSLPYSKNEILILTAPLNGMDLRRNSQFVFHYQNCWLFESR